ncbi:MAG: beta-glycosidase, partial [Flavobacterium sp.]
MTKRFCFPLLFIIASTVCSFSQSQIYSSNIVSAPTSRTVLDLTNLNWKLWLDTAAKWANDTLYAPPVSLERLPINIPSGGWNAFMKNGKTIRIPATVEQLYWGANGNSHGVAGNYVGVSWFTTVFKIPVSTKGKRIVLQFESVRYRAEVFVNQKLVGYDLVNGTPFELDISPYVDYDKPNQLAVRITDPNGNFDWRDSQNFMWGKYRTNPTHGFGGITGKVKLITTENVYTSDVFVKNKPKANEIDIEITSQNELSNAVNGRFVLEIKEAKTKGKVVYRKEYNNITLSLGTSTNHFSIHVPEAKLWSVDTPNLY